MRSLSAPDLRPSLPTAGLQVAFKPVAGAAHSVVLTSGTLAPLEGFASEVRAQPGASLLAGLLADAAC